jgi:hypothetical protein
MRALITGLVVNRLTNRQDADLRVSLWDREAMAHLLQREQVRPHPQDQLSLGLRGFSLATCWITRMSMPSI